MVIRMKKAGAGEDLFPRERIEIDFMDAKESFPFILGRVHYACAHSPLGPHAHEGRMEIVYVEKGRQVYMVDGMKYVVHSGEFFHTFADELHSTANFPEDKSLIYYLIIDIEKLKNGFLGYGAEDGEAIAKSLYGLRSRVFRAKKNYKADLDRVISAYFSDSGYRNTIIRNLISEYMIGMIESARSQPRGTEAVLQEVLDYIERHVEEEIDVPALAKIAHISVSSFQSKFRRHLGFPPREYVLRRKVERAKKLLRTTGESVTTLPSRSPFPPASILRRYSGVSRS